MSKQKFPAILFLLFLILTIFSIVIAPDDFYNNITETLSIWLYNVYPSIFTFYIISSCLINFNIISRLTFFLKPFIKFECAKSYELFLTAMFVGNPSCASLTMNELNFKTITLNDANKLLKVCSFFNPLFIISVITLSKINEIKYAFLIILSSFFTNIIISMFLYNKRQIYVNNINKPIIINFDKLLSSINNVIQLLLIVSGIMVFSNILKFSLMNFIYYFKVNSITIRFILSNFEASTGVMDDIEASYSLPLTLALISFILSFQGLSINFQVFNVIREQKNIIFFPILLIRFMQAIISFCLTYLIFIIFY